MEIIDHLIDLIEQGDRKTSLLLIEEWIHLHPDEDVILTILDPFLNRVGMVWQQGGLTLAQAYVATKIAEEVITRFSLDSGDKGTSGPKKGPVVMGNVEGDFHGLGRRMVTTSLIAAGWEVHDLGNDVPPEVFVDTAQQIGAKVIGVSAMMYSTAENILHIRSILDERGLSGSIMLVVGGAVFRIRPELVDEVGGDGTAVTSTHAPSVFSAMWERSIGGDRHD